MSPFQPLIRAPRATFARAATLENRGSAAQRCLSTGNILQKYGECRNQETNKHTHIIYV